ncbi:pseudouridine synthase [Ralstonia syzygii]|uniref:pseudouridine synthase n=1 Tax=Ralstonia syzygii TaxID=28097 RepID=UPI0036F1AFFA
MRLAKGVPKSHIYRILRSGEVRVNKGRIDAEYRLKLGDLVRIPPLRIAQQSAQQAEAARAVPAAEFTILHEDTHLLVIDKPAGVAVHGGSGVAFGVIEQLRQSRPEAKFLELVHRLDRETSGVLLLAKKRSALVALHEQIREGQLDKRYFAAVKGLWPHQRQHIKAPLFKYTTPEGEAARARAGRRTAIAHGVQQGGGVRPLHAAGGRAEDRPHAPDSRTPRARRLPHSRRRQIRRFRAQQGIVARERVAAAGPHVPACAHAAADASAKW